MASTSSFDRASSERGAILIQVGLSILVLSAFAMFIVDYGVLWVSRNQAQNAADSGALAGAISLAWDDFDDHSDTGPAKQAARQFALDNHVWGEEADVNMATDVRFYSDAPAAFPASCSNDDCVRVDVYRNQARDKALPMFFGWLVGVREQGVRATAIAQASAANATNCLKPWAVPDKWKENNDPTNFDPVGPPADVYTAPGYTLDDIGTELVLKPSNATGDPLGTPGWFQELSLPAVQGPKSDYEQNIFNCTTATYAVGETVSIENLPGNRSGPTIHGTETLIDLDPHARWDSEKNKVVDSCVGPPYSCSQPGFAQSPRIVAIPVFDTQHYYETGGPGKGEVLINNFLGFFVKSVEADGNGNGGGQQKVVGVLASTVGLSVSNRGHVAPSAAFLKVIQLVR